jgi:hypothetical protein
MRLIIISSIGDNMKAVRTLKDKTTMPVLVIPVSSKIIATAVQRDSHHCMIVDAVKKRIPKAQYISVDLQSIRFSDPDTKIRYKYFTPLPGQINLVKFDQGHEVKPFTLTLKDGTKEVVGWKPKHKTAERKRKYSSTGKKRKGMAKKERKFGLRNLE